MRMELPADCDMRYRVGQDEYNSRVRHAWEDQRSHNFLVRPVAELAMYAALSFNKEETSSFKIGNIIQKFPYDDMRAGYQQVMYDMNARRMSGNLKWMECIVGQSSEYQTANIPSIEDSRYVATSSVLPDGGQGDGQN